MKKTVNHLLFIMFAGAVLFLASGCRQTRARWDWTTQRPTGTRTGEFIGTGPAGTDIGDIGSGEDLGLWGPVGQPPGTMPGDLIEVPNHPLSQIVIYFAFDSSAIGTSERPKLEAMADELQRDQEYHLVIEGHCDERGSAEYNRGLGERRALAVKQYLTDLGVDANRLNTVSYGIERPVILNATSEADHARNRRAEFLVGIKP